MSSPKARIFISHSAKETQAREVQEALTAALQEKARAERFALLLDKVTLEAGDMWRSRINLWVGGCDAAVILLSKAALESSYVAYEVSILSYRQAMKDSLLLIPVLLEEVAPEDLAKGRLSPAQLAEIHAVQGKTTEEIVQEVLARLETVVPGGETPLERRARHLAELLDDFDKDDLVEAGKKAALDLLDTWMPFAEEKLRLRLAAQLLSVGMIGAAPAVLHLRGKIRKKDDQVIWVNRVLRLVASAWVDPRSFDRLPRIAKGEEKIAAVGLNASHELTAEMYLVSASCGDPEDTWRWAPCNDVVAADSLPQVIRKLGDSVERTIASLLKCEPDEVAAELELLNSILPQPVIVFLRADGMNDEILTALRDRFKHVTFFLLLGKGAAAGPRLSAEMFEILFPELAPDDESHFLDKYKKFEATVRVR